ncbi:MAG: polysaccharide biosynthesis tyrosine autokinase [candidate division WOR-3 bacterium]|nr:MAG: polysaccharide biosynthesis tyrosine autokinase [candidate division WOR-3 bacterium]
MAEINRPAPARSPRPAVTGEQMGLRDYLEKLNRRKWLALGVFVVVLGLTAVSIVRTKPVYVARATLMLTTSDESSILSQMSPPYLWPRGPNLDNCVELIRSRSVAERVAQRLPDTMRLPPGALRGMISARPIRETDIIQLTAAAGSPRVAVMVVNAYAETYQEYDLEQNRSDVSTIRQFIDDQLVVAKARLDSSEQILADFKRSHQLTSLPAETEALVGQQAGMAAAFQQATVDVQATESELTYVRERMDQEAEGMADRIEGISSPMVASLRAALNQLEVERANLMMRGFDESSERIQGLERQIDSTRARLKAESQALVAQQGFVDPVGRLSGLFESALALDAKLAAAKARRRALSGVLSRYESSIARLPEAERVLAGLTRDVETGRRVHALLSERREEARIREVGRTPSVRLLDRALGAGRTKPNIPSSVSFGLVLALALALGTAFVVDYLDSAVQGPRELQRQGWTVLGNIPLLPGKTGRRRRGRKEVMTSHLITHSDSESSGAEAFRMLRSNLALTNTDRPLRTIVVTSAGPSEGKSTVAINLASVLAQAGSRVLLVDADLRHPMLHSVFGRKRQPGLTDLIISDSGAENTVFKSGIDQLFILPSGSIPPSPADLLVSTSAAKLLGRLAGTYDYVVFDTPPVLIAADAPTLGSMADVTILVVRAGRTAVDAVEMARDALLNTGSLVVGCVLNGVSPSSRYGRYYYYYKYKSHYSQHTPDPEPGTAKTKKA